MSASRCRSAVPPCGAHWIDWASLAKKTLRASEQDRPDVRLEREIFQQKVEQVDPKRLYFFDEFGFNLGMTRGYARAPSSERAHGNVPTNVGKAITLVMGIGLAGVVAPCAFEGAMNGHLFGIYLLEQVVPLLPPDAIVVVDNLPAHHDWDVCDVLEERGIVVLDEFCKHRLDDAWNAPKKRGIQLWFLPPYSPQMSPVEECGSKVKALTRAKDPRTQSDVIDAMGHAIAQVTPQDARGWFEHARRDRASRPRPELPHHSNESGAPPHRPASSAG